MGPFAYELTALLHELAGVGCVERVLGSGRAGEKQGTRHGVRRLPSTAKVLGIGADPASPDVVERFDPKSCSWVMPWGSWMQPSLCEGDAWAASCDDFFAL